MNTRKILSAGTNFALPVVSAGISVSVWILREIFSSGESKDHSEPLGDMDFEYYSQIAQTNGHPAPQTLEEAISYFDEDSYKDIRVD